MFGNKNIIVIWISANQLTILGGKLTAPESLVFPPNVVANLEILDQDALYGLIKDWASKQTSQQSEIIWVFGQDVYYETTLKDEEVDKDERESVIVRFLDLLPFENVESRSYMDVEGTKIVAINQEFYDALKRGFALQGYWTRAEIAAGYLGQAADQGLNASLVSYINKNMEAIERARLVMPGLDPNEIKRPTKEKKKSSLPLLLSVFGVLVLILGILIWRMNA